jgi:hypothetical protein
VCIDERIVRAENGLAATKFALINGVRDDESFWRMKMLA